MGNIQPGVGYTLVDTPDGSSLEIQFPTIDPKEVANSLLQQFQLVIVDNQLQVVGGTVLWASHNFEPLDDADAGADKCANQSYISNFARYTGDSVSVGTDSTSPFMSEGGHVTINP